MCVSVLCNRDTGYNSTWIWYLVCCRTVTNPNTKQPNKYHATYSVLCSERANHVLKTALVIPHYPQIKTLLSRLLSLRAQSWGTSFESRCSLHDTSKLSNDPENTRRNNVFVFGSTIKIASVTDRTDSYFLMKSFACFVCSHECFSHSQWAAPSNSAVT